MKGARGNDRLCGQTKFLFCDPAGWALSHAVIAERAAAVWQCVQQIEDSRRENGQQVSTFHLCDLLRRSDAMFPITWGQRFEGSRRVFHPTP